MYNRMSLSYIESACVRVDVAHCVISKSYILSDYWLASLVFFSLKLNSYANNAIHAFLIIDCQSWEWTSLTIKKLVLLQNGFIEFTYLLKMGLSNLPLGLWPYLICRFGVFVTFSGECCNFQTIVFGRTVCLTFKMYSTHVCLPYRVSVLKHIKNF